MPHKSRCRLYKFIFMANAKLRALDWKKGQLKTQDLQGLLRSVLTKKKKKMLKAYKEDAICLKLVKP